jgi:dTDP-4-dehydrorhamnose reductase
VRVLVLGASGMLGHKMLQVLSERFETSGTTRSTATGLDRVASGAQAVLQGVSAGNLDSVVGAFVAARPDVVVNCIGIVKQLDEAKNPIASIEVNSLFPHQLASICAAHQAQLVHVSTDCVFSGRKGGYTEDDTPDPVDLYGRSKLLGEVGEDPVLTIRTSIVGRELHGAHGLVEWFLGQSGTTVRGFTRAIFSGWSTAALARAVGDVIERQPTLTGIWHVAAEPIAKYDLLCRLRDAFDLDVAIEPDDELECDRSLDGSRFAAETGIIAPSWSEMVDELHRESPLYESLREPSVAGR